MHTDTLRIPGRFADVAKAATKEDRRFALTHVHLSTDGTTVKVEATDGRILVRAESNGQSCEAFDTLIPADVFSKALRASRGRKVGGDWHTVRLERDDDDTMRIIGAGTVTTILPEERGTFPQTDDVIPTTFAPDGTVGFDPVLLSRVTSVVGAVTGADVLSLRIGAAKFPSRLDAEHEGRTAVGVIMPKLLK